MCLFPAEVIYHMQTLKVFSGKSQKKVFSLLWAGGLVLACLSALLLLMGEWCAAQVHSEIPKSA